MFFMYLFLSCVFDCSSVLLLTFSKVFAFHIVQVIIIQAKFKKCLELEEQIQYSGYFPIPITDGPFYGV